MSELDSMEAKLKGDVLELERREKELHDLQTKVKAAEADVQRLKVQLAADKRAVDKMAATVRNIR